MVDDPTTKKIRDYYKRQEQETELFARQLASEVNKRINKIVRDVENLDSSIETRLSLETLRRIESLEELFISAGYQDLLDSLAIGYASELRQARELIESNLDQQVRYTDFEKRAFETAIRLNIDDITTTIRSNIGSAKAILYAGVISGSNITEGQVEELSSTLQNRVETELRTSRSRFQQAVTNAKAEDLGLQYYVYRGPDDKVTRDFCRRVLQNPILTKSEIEALDNGQVPNVFENRGGYNCRHHWAPISAERAKEFGRTDARGES